MAAPDAEMAWGYCVHCGAYAYGRYRWPINDRAEAIDQHVGCPFLLVAEEAPRLDIERAGDDREVVDADVVDAVLESADRLVVEAGQRGEL